MKRRKFERSRMVALRLTPEEHRRLLEEAARAHLPLSAYIRHRLFGEPTAKRRKKGGQ